MKYIKKYKHLQEFYDRPHSYTPEPQGRGVEGLGLARGWLGIRKWAQHGPNLNQVGANPRPTWAQLEPTWSQLGPNWRLDWLK